MLTIALPLLAIVALPALLRLLLRTTFGVLFGFVAILFVLIVLQRATVDSETTSTTAPTTAAVAAPSIVTAPLVPPSVGIGTDEPDGIRLVLFDTNAIYAYRSSRPTLAADERPAVSDSVVSELPTLPPPPDVTVIPDTSNVTIIQQVRSRMRDFGAPEADNTEIDAVIGATAFEGGLPLMTQDGCLANAVVALGGEVRTWDKPLATLECKR